MPTAGQAGNANLEERAGLEPVQHKGQPEVSKAKGLNAFMAAKLANAIGKGTKLGTAWQGVCSRAYLLDISAGLLTGACLPAATCMQIYHSGCPLCLLVAARCACVMSSCVVCCTCIAGCFHVMLLHSVCSSHVDKKPCVIFQAFG